MKTSKRFTEHIYYRILFIGVVVALCTVPLLISVLNENRRLDQIERILKEQRHTETIAQSILESEADGTLRILFTGNTHGYLQPCGCFSGQLGGISRRATLIKELRKNDPSLVHLDIGRIFPLTQEIDALYQLSSDAYIRSMKLIGYDLIHLTKEDLNWEQQIRSLSSTFPLISGVSNRPFSIKQAEILESDVYRIGVISAMLVNQTEGKLENLLSFVENQIHLLKNEQVDFFVLLTDLERHECTQLARQDSGIHVILSIAGSESVSFSVEDTLIAFPGNNGKRLGVIDVALAESPVTHIQYVDISDTIVPDPVVEDVIVELYYKISQNPELSKSHVVLPSQIIPEFSENYLVGADSCRTCHLEEHNQWLETKHAYAFNTLKQVQRSLHPNCVPCHVTGFGNESGYQFSNPSNELYEGVQCESCHGPGGFHVSDPMGPYIKKQVDQTVCLECHDQEHSLGFNEVVQLHYPDIDHTRTLRNSFEEHLKRRIKQNPSKPKVELWVMSYCPFGTQAESKILPVIEEYKNQVDFQLRFIASETDHPAGEVDVSKIFRSLHGRKEVLENIRQLLIQKYYPEKLFSYLLCRAKNIEEPWQRCAEKLGINVSQIQSLSGNQEGITLLRENIIQKTPFRITSSPTLLLDERMINNQLLLNVQQTCQRQ